MMSSVPAQPDRDIVMNDLIDALRVFAVESDVFVDVFARAHGLGRSDLNAIMWISTGTTSGRPITIGELAQRLGRSPAATTALVDRLETTGHVSRLRDPTNRRRVTIHIHDRALRLASAFFSPLGRLMHEAAHEQSDRDLALTATVVRQLTGAVTAARVEATKRPSVDASGRP
jgi:DNA-binding MarR family transcriptional regulator